MADATAKEAVALEIKPTPRMWVRVWLLVVAACVITIVLGSLLLGDQGTLFAPRTTLTAYMPDASGLEIDSEVRLSGISIGKVSSIAISGSNDSKRAVRAELRVLKQFLTGIPSDSLTGIRADTLVGSQFVDIAEGKSPVPIGENGVLESEPVVVAADRADLIKSLQDRLKQVDSILSDLSSTDTDIGRFLLGEGEYDNLLASIRGIDAGVHRFLTPRSEFFQAFHTLADYNAWRSMVDKADQQLAAIESNPLLASTKQYDDLMTGLPDVRTTLDQLKANGLITDDAAYQRLVRTLRETDRTLASINQGEGRAGNLLVSAQAYEQLNGTLRKLQALLVELRDSPGKFLRSKLF
jgi:phospholipid/cholesterol/gamma-HCH transport system substrate-binding protein